MSMSLPSPSRSFFTLAMASLLASVSVASACATTSTTSSGQASGTCRVEDRGLFAGRHAVVHKGVARVRMGRADRDVARIDGDGVIVLLRAGGDVEKTSASFDGMHLKIARLADTELRSDAIADGEVRVTNPRSPGLYTYTDACTKADAAVGAFALFTLDAETRAEAVVSFTAKARGE
jgi:hypothetical protein